MGVSVSSVISPGGRSGMFSSASCFAGGVQFSGSTARSCSSSAGVGGVTQRSDVGGFLCGLGDFSVHVRQAQGVVFVACIWRIVSGQPAGVSFERDRRYGEKAVAVIGRIFVGRENTIGIGLQKLLIGLVGVVTQPDLFMRHAARIELGDDRG